MKKIRWLTAEQVERAAVRGRKAALLCSIKHWEQLSSASKEQILNIPHDYLCREFCALCTRYDYNIADSLACASCKLNCLNTGGIRRGSWYKASYAHSSYLKHRCLWDWAEWKWASKALLRRVIKLYEKEYGVYKHE